MILTVIACVATAAGLPSTFPRGWNREATSPPMAWRSWNAFYANINDGIIRDSIAALVNKSMVGADGKTPTSLYDVGFHTIGIDEGWEGCGQGVNHTQHDAKGNPVIDTKKFPDMAGLGSAGHAKNVKMGWYQNGCACGERHALLQNYQGDVRKLAEFNFDAVKLDGCGAQLNMSLYASLMKATGKSFEIENCHWGDVAPYIPSDDSSAPTAEWCPFNLYRTSGDIRATWASFTRNLHTALPYLSPKSPLSGPSCWAYPDMLQVGNLPNFEQNRAHFGAWVIISAPLYLGFDLRNTTLLESVWPILGNEEAIAINQQYAGHPGMRVKAWTPSTPAIDKYYIVTGTIGHTGKQEGCSKGWKVNKDTSTISTPPIPTATET